MHKPCRLRLSHIDINRRRSSLLVACSAFHVEVMLMPMVQKTCDLCGKSFRKKQVEVHEHNFCCREHFYRWNGLRVAAYNQSSNPMNKPGGVLHSRIRRSEIQRGRGEGKTYRKLLGRHEHRRVAETAIGRPLRNGEIVHHIDGNKLNNAPENLLVLPSRAEHARIHFSKKERQVM